MRASQNTEEYDRNYKAAIVAFQCKRKSSQVVYISLSRVTVENLHYRN